MKKNSLLKAKHEVKHTYTFIIASNANGSTYKFSLSAFWMKNLVLIVSLMLFMFLLLTLSYASLLQNYNRSKSDMYTLQAINREQKEQMFQLNVLAQTVEQKLLQLDLLTTRVKLLMEDDQSSGTVNPKIAEIDARIEALDLIGDYDGRGGGSSGTYLNYYIATNNFEELDITYSLEQLYARLDTNAFRIDSHETTIANIAFNYELTNDFAQCYPDFKPTEGHISSLMGWRTDPKPEFHGGIDIANKYKTPIYSAGKGKVISAGWGGSYGYNIVIDHGYGYKTRYAHCSELLVKTGDTVQKGDLIALMGSTGYSTGNHLHFEVIENGIRIDPRKFVDFE